MPKKTFAGKSCIKNTNVDFSKTNKNDKKIQLKVTVLF